MVGIYKITSPTNKVYIGQTWDIDKRKQNYSSLKCKGQTKLYNSLVKHGWDKHIFETELQLDNNISQQQLDECEVKYWQQYKDQGFEMLNLKEPGLGGKWNEEMKKKFKEKRNTDKWKNFISSVHKGKNVSEEVRKKQSISRIGKKHSPETMVKIHNRPKPTASNIQKRVEKIRKEVICITTNQIFPSAKEASEYFNIDRAGISKVARGVNNHINQLIFKYT